MIPYYYDCPWCNPDSCKNENIDMLQFIFGLQCGFQNRYKERFKFTKFLTSIALLVESMELMLKTEFKGKHNFKWWSKKEVPDRAKRVEELVDILHFFLLYMREEKIGPEELFKVYLAKLAENYARQESGTY